MGVPSYVYPADILPNVEALAPFVDNIEISLFQSEQLSALPAPVTVERLRQLALDHELIYTIHFPMDRKLGSPQSDERESHQQQILKIMALTRPLDPLAYVLHLEGIEPDAHPATVKIWQDTVSEMLPAIVAQAKHPAQICIENLLYPFAWCDVFLERFGLGACLDTGHLTRSGGDVHRHFRQYADRIQEIHLHGVKDGRDHLPLTVLPEAWLDRFLNSIDNFTGVLTLELFEFAAVRLSMERLSQCLMKHSHDPNSK
ncbi:MAG: sugar phosphate isomerase/epimerase [Verrucomicrobia bacterium]|nr:sugar phosphate isomerase/epimerase [Verrucomicrobiota bacterium]